MTQTKVTNGVILAENDMLMRDIIRSVLQRAEQQIFPVADGLEAIMLARQFRARLVLLDIAMPRLNGLLACEAIRALEGYADVPIVMLTGFNDTRLRQAAQRLGAVDFITKPVRPNVLLARLAPYLDIPAHAMPPAEGESDPWGGRAQVWRTPDDPRSAQGEHPQLANGREVMRIFRSAERKL
jgi:CheY-like chemotaxis protein